MEHALAILGPTASGKTGLSILLAERMNGEIVSADSRQFYRSMDIGTAKPSVEELRRVRHHFINILEPEQEYNAAEYGIQARLKIMEMLGRNCRPIIVGGSGLYIRAVVDGFFAGPGKSAELRKKLESEAKKYGSERLYRRLVEVDPSSASKMDATKVRRIIRALEVYETTGKAISEFHTNQESRPSFGIVQFGLDWERRELYERIDRRVDRMIDAGLIGEVTGLMEKGYNCEINALNSVGYREVFYFLDGKISKDEMVALIKRNSRRFAKRQLTWFRADKRIRWVRVGEETEWNDVAKKINDTLDDVIKTGKISN
jgi:tRNA dimethylallyltransferase